MHVVFHTETEGSYQTHLNELNQHHLELVQLHEAVRAVSRKDPLHSVVQGKSVTPYQLTRNKISLCTTGCSSQLIFRVYFRSIFSCFIYILETQMENRTK